MKLALLLIAQLVSFNLFAQTLNLEVGQVYTGNETYNDQETGKICHIIIRDIIELKRKGLHCYKVSFSFESERTDLPMGDLSVDSRITNYHREEYPTLKTCALNIDGTTFGDEIYQDDTTILYNRIFGGMHTTKKTRFDYFLTLAPHTKEAISARIHIKKRWKKDYNIDCVNLVQTEQI